MATHNEIGRWGEELAAAFLQGKGYTIVERDWKSGHRDIDIVARLDNEMVFVEVKTRRNDYFGEPIEAVDWKKRKNLTIAINHYIKLRAVSLPCRFDIVAIVGTPWTGQPEITHIENVPLY